METLSYRIVLRSVKVLNVILMAVLMIFCWQGNYAGGVQSSDMARNMTGLVALIFIFLYMTYGRIYDSFLVSLFRISEMIYSQWLALLMADTLMYIILSLVTQQLVRFLPIVITLIMQMGYLSSGVWLRILGILRNFHREKHWLFMTASRM